MTTYRTFGTLTNPLQDDDAVAAGREYLTSDDMTNYLDAPLKEVVLHIEWHLQDDGFHYYVEAQTNRDLTDGEQKALSAWVSGQNSDGLGEGFEQQDFAQVPADDYGYYDDENDYYDGEIEMCSFDWKTNELAWVKVSA